MRALVLLVVVGCSGYDKDLGPTPFLCGSAEPRCPNGYDCMTDPASGSDVCSNGDMQPFSCLTDMHEPNETFTAATHTTIDTMKTFHLAGLAICPATDKDTFAFAIGTAGESVAVTVSYAANGMPLKASILSANAMSLGDAMPVDGMPTTIRATAATLGVGMYFAQVYGTDAQNNYALTIEVTGP